MWEPDGGIPVARDIGVWTGEHHQHLAVVCQRLTGGIGPCQMKTQTAQFAAIRIEHHRHVGSIEAAGHLGYERRENVAADKIVGDSGVVL